MIHFGAYSDYLEHWLFRAIRDVAMQKAGGRCIHCGARATEVHHIRYPKPWGAFDTHGNLEPVCHACHCRIEGKAK